MLRIKQWTLVELSRSLQLLVLGLKIIQTCLKIIKTTGFALGGLAVGSWLWLIRGASGAYWRLFVFESLRGDCLLRHIGGNKQISLLWTSFFSNFLLQVMICCGEASGWLGLGSLFCFARWLKLTEIYLVIFIISAFCILLGLNLLGGLGFKNGLPAKLLVSDAFTGDAYIDELISATLASRSQLREAWCALRVIEQYLVLEGEAWLACRMGFSHWYGFMDLDSGFWKLLLHFTSPFNLNFY
jgi:hypothetical protein